MSNGPPPPTGSPGAPPPPPERNILDVLGAGSAITVVPKETDDERSHRLTIGLYRFFFTHVLGAVLLVALTVFGMYEFANGVDATAKQGGLGLLTAILGAVIGFYAGEKSGK